MNEVALDQSIFPRKTSARIFGTRETRQSSAFYGYSLCVIAMGLGWILRDYELISPEKGLGYWLGIVGGSMMLLLLLYPLRKRFKAWHILGDTQHWFRGHMILGLLGPLLVLYHSNFSIGSFNSQVALVCMLIVAGSGVIGRDLYARIHRGLYGRKTSLKELRDDLANSLEKSRGFATLLPKFTVKLEALAAEAQGDRITGSMGTGASFLWTFKQYAVWYSLSKTAHRELQARASESATVAKDYRKLKQVTSTYIRRSVRLTGRVAQFTLCERLFSVWHVLHMPLFFMMVISALIHVLAVHMY